MPAVDAKSAVGERPRQPGFGAFSPLQCAPAESLSRGGASGQEGDGVDLDLRVQQQAGDLHGGAGGRVFRKELSADA